MSGSSTLVSWLLRHDLLDQLDLLVFPVVIGSGKRLFSEPGGQVPLTLTGSESHTPAWSTSATNRPHSRNRSGPARADSGDGAAVLEVDQSLAAGGRPHPPPDRAPEQVERVRERREPGLGDLLGLQHQAG